MIEENGRRGHAAATPNELGKEQEEEDRRLVVSKYCYQISTLAITSITSTYFFSNTALIYGMTRLVLDEMISIYKKKI
jgi:hypothetical protein